MADQDEQQERLDALGKQIAEAREHAEDVIPEMEDDEQRFHESGEVRPQDDDQTAAPG